MPKPLVSVIMPVYNAQNYVEEAILSILNQTYQNFEFIIINDGSTDKSLEIIQEYAKKDNRIKVISRENKGLIYSLNEGIKLSKGKYIARMDADDISLSYRFEKQIEFMENNLDVGICGSSAIVFDDKTEKKWIVYKDENRIKAELLFSSPFIHPSVMIRKSIIDKYNFFYDKDYIHAEDLELWVRMSDFVKLANIQDILFKYRDTPNSVTNKADKDTEKRYKVIKNIFSFYLKKLDIKNNEKENLLHFYLTVNHRIKDNKIDKNELYNYFEKIVNANKVKKIFDDFSLKKVLGKRWLWYVYYKKDFKAIFSKYFVYGLLGLKK